MPVVLIERKGRMVADSRAIAREFGRHHHNVLSSLDRVLAQCPAAAAHVEFAEYAVTAGLGGTRRARHAYVDRCAFMLMAMAFPTSTRELALEWALALSS